MDIDQQLLFGTIEENAPLVVLLEALRAQPCNTTRFVNSLLAPGPSSDTCRRFVAAMINEPVMIRSKEEAAVFIRPKDPPAISEIRDEFKRIESCVKGDPKDVVSKLERKIGRNGFPNLRVLYRVCRTLGEQLSSEASVEDMLAAAFDKKTQIRWERVNSVWEALHDMRSLQEQVVPSSPEGALCLSAILYSYNIRHASNHLRAFSNLKAGSSTALAREFTSDTHPLVRDLTVTFDTKLPDSVYSHRALEQLCAVYGVRKRSSKDDMLARLKTAATCERFYPFCLRESSTPVMLLDVSPETRDIDLISYGVLEGPDSSVDPKDTISISVAELEGALMHTQSVQNIFTKEGVFSAENMGQLSSIIHLGLWSGYPDPLPAEFEPARQKLERAIALATEKNETVEDLMTSVSQTQMIAFIEKLLDLAMIMRGWDGQGERLSVDQRTSGVDPENNELIYVKLVEIMDPLFENRRCLELPLYEYRSGNFVECRSKEVGRTIRRRLEIVSENKGESACIRVTSNLLLVSAYHFSILWKVHAPFVLADLKYLY